MSLISYSVGAGFVGLPFAFLHLGIPLSLFLIVVVCLQTYISCSLYLKVRSIIPGSYETFYELSYILFGKSSIYYIAMNITINGWGMTIVYYIVFSDICVSLVQN